MKLTPETNNYNEYLESTEIVDYTNDNVKMLADKLVKNITDELQIIKTVYEYVRDEISHSFDIEGKVVTCTSVEVLKHKEGICYAKSHLLAALLRYLKIPTGFCYQKLILDDEKKPILVLHGLNAVYIKSINKWIRVDARGNKEDVNAEFNVNEEKLAFNIRQRLGEMDYPTIYINPNIKIIESLKTCNDIEELEDHLPTEL